MNGASGTGPGTVSYGVAANNATNSRTGVVSVAGRAHTVRQDAGSPPRDEDRPVEVSGRAFLVNGSCPNLSFVVELQRVFTTGDTKFRGSCGNLRSGSDVRVEGRLQSDGRIRATEVRVREDDDN